MLFACHGIHHVSDLACYLHLQQQMLACADEGRPFYTANTLQLQWHHRGSLDGNVVQLISHSLLVVLSSPANLVQHKQYKQLTKCHHTIAVIQM